MPGRGRGCVKRKTDLAVNQVCRIQTSKSRRFDSRLGFLTRISRFAKVPSLFTQPRPRVRIGSQTPGDGLYPANSGRCCIETAIQLPDVRDLRYHAVKQASSFGDSRENPELSDDSMHLCDLRCRERLVALRDRRALAERHKICCVVCRFCFMCYWS
jgi:hypothetical protein